MRLEEVRKEEVRAEEVRVEEVREEELRLEEVRAEGRAGIRAPGSRLLKVCLLGETPAPSPDAS